MKHVTTAGAALGLLALFLAVAALVAGGGGEDATAALGALNASVSALDGRVGALRADVASAAGKGADASKTVEDLGSRIERAERETARLAKAVAEIPERPAAAGAGIDQDKLRELIQAEMRTAREEQARQMGDRIAATFRNDLGLTEEKAGKVVEIQRKMLEEVGRVWRENRGDRDAARKAMEELRAKAEKEMAEFLTEDELAKVREWRDQQIQQRGGGLRGNRGGRNQPAQDAGEGGAGAPAPF